MHDFFFQTFLLSSWNQTTLPSTCCSWGAVHSLSNRVNGAKKKNEVLTTASHNLSTIFFGFISPPDLLLYERAAHLVNRYPSLISSRSPGLSSGVKLCRPPCPRGRATDLGHTVPVLQLLTHIHPGRQPQSSFYPWTRAHPLSSGLAETGAQGETVIGIQFWLARQIAC